METKVETVRMAARRCPACGSTLLAVHRHGIEVDRCPDCGGVWLDHGEYSRLVEKVLRRAIAAEEIGFEKFDRGEPRPRGMRPSCRATYDFW